MIGGNVDLDLLSLLPQELARIIGGIERLQAQRRSIMGEEHEQEEIRSKGEEDPLL